MKNKSCMIITEVKTISTAIDLVDLAGRVADNFYDVLYEYLDEFHGEVNDPELFVDEHGDEIWNAVIAHLKEN